MYLRKGLGGSLEREEDFKGLDLLAQVQGSKLCWPEAVNGLLIDQYMGFVQICNFQFCGVV